MRKIALATLAAVLVVLPTVAQAQVGTATGTANISARVYTALTVTPANSVDLGTAIQGTATTLTVDPKSGGTKAASFTVAGQKNALINVTEPATATLTLSGGTATLTFNAAWADGTTSTQGSATAGTITSTTLNASGNWYFWLGGNVVTTASAPASTETGTYAGTMTLTVSYP